MDVRKHAAGGDCDLAEELVELLVVADRELEVARDDARLLVVAGRVDTCTAVLSLCHKSSMFQNRRLLKTVLKPPLKPPT